jgi:DMSO/TMAO reductase YedYZ molybdopterin-dependent catalytic subunit
MDEDGWVRLRPAVGILIALLAAGAALAAGELTAVLIRPAASPIIAVGNRFIEFTPVAVKEWAISVFGTNDKSALLTGIYLSLVLFAVLVGLLTAVRPALGIAGIAVLGAVGGYCAATAPGHRPTDVIPSIVAGVVGAATLAALLAAMRPRGEVTDASGIDRRRLLQVGGLAAGFAVIGTILGRGWQHQRGLAQARNALTLPAPASSAPALALGTDLGKGAVPFVTPNAKFYRVDTALAIPEVDPKTWTLQLHGRVDREITLRYSDLVARPLIERWITLCCVSNEVGGDLISNARFLGARLADILREAGIHADADQLVATSADGMTIGTPTAAVLDGRDAMLAIGMNGQPLPLGHGFPVRMVVPGLYGYVSACKWIVDIEATTFADTDAYWVARGYAQHPPIQLSSRIDTPKSTAALPVGQTIAIAGIAWDQHVGVRAVQVQIDGGAWQDARLAPVPSIDTWRQWVFPWTVPSSGTHRIAVRAVAADGTKQDETLRDSFPAGATGLHQIMVTGRSSA